MPTHVCPTCATALADSARFCHRCGTPVAGAARVKRAWIAAGVVTVLLLAAIGFGAIGGWNPPAPPPPPDMANVGSVAGARRIDVSAMSPEERFDRLFRRTMNAGAEGDSAAVRTFTPMALASYAQLPSPDVLARYRAALLRLQVGDFVGVTALADTIEAGSPRHLFGPILRGTVARLTNDSAMVRQSYRRFLDNYDAERARRPEYDSEEPALAEFRQAARAALP